MNGGTKGPGPVPPGEPRKPSSRRPSGGRPGDALRSVRLRLNHEFGWALPRLKRSLWVLGEVPEAFETDEAFIQSLAVSAPHCRLVMMSSEPRTLDWLRNKFVDDEVLTLPRDSDAVAQRYFGRLRPALIIALSPAGPNSSLLLEQARTNSLPVIVRRPGAPDDGGLIRRLLEPAPYEHPVKQAWHVPTWRDRAGRSRVWRSFAPYLSGRRIDDWDGLRLRLGNPRSILCLGNGPSSEDPGLAGLDHDCLMRVNWRWKARGFLSDPDIVFVGDAATLHRLSPRIFGLWNIQLEYGMLLRYLVTHGLRRMEYFTMERISPIVRDRFWPARPSNGSLMVAAAASLRPERLTIAGIDLFRHPDGRYPGDNRSLNEYSRVHTRDVDIAIIDLALKNYSGELVIFGDTLRQALADVRTGHASPSR
jgi:hypothetical protein